MRRIAHLSDLHFGKADPQLTQSLLQALERLAPDLILVSGDLTQRAKEKEFKAARQFLQKLKSPYLVIPGNHDVPLYHLVERLTQPFARYRRFIQTDLRPRHIDQEIFVIGANTAHGLTISNGRLKKSERTLLRDEIREATTDQVRILAIHHPLNEIPVGFDIVCTGHLHRTQARMVLNEAKQPVLLLQAGTAISTRHRGELNSFNWMEVQHSHIRSTSYCWNDQQKDFVQQKIAAFQIPRLIQSLSRDGDRRISGASQRFE